MSYIGNLPFGKTLRTVTSATANGSATVFYPDGGYDVNFVDVFASGARLSSGLDYTASDGISITLLYTPADGDTIDMVAYGLLELVSPVFPVSVTVGSNVVINTTSISVGNSSINTQIVAGNVTLNGSTLKVGNSSVNTVITGNSVTIGGTLTVTGNVALTTNSVNSSMLTTTGVIANSYGNTTAIPVITVDAAGRITNATTSSVSGVTGLSFAPANSTITVSTSTTNFDAAITSGNDSVQGLLKVIDSVSNTSTLIASSANSVTTAYLLAANAVSNATAYAATAYSNAVATAASDATTKAGTAYSNAVATAASDATTKAGTAYSNATAYADTMAGTAYSNAVATAASDATTKAGTAYSNATAYADTKAGTAYSNAISYANTASGTAYSNAASYADTKAAAAYSNVFNGGTFSGAVVMQANLTANSVRMNGDLQIDGNLTVSGNSVTINVTNLNVDDNMIYLNSNSTVSHPDLGFAGNYNDGTYAHAGLFRDATDGVWKFFHGYTPEPDASLYIDTSNSSFTLSNLQINYVIGNVTGSANSATYLGGNTASTLRSYSDTMAGTAYSNATTYAATIAGTAYSNAVSVAASDATTKAGTAYSNATTYAATIAGTAYSNAVSVAASDATTKAGTAYSNATTYAATIAGTAYSNATTYAATIAGTAYSNAIAFAANASNISSGTLSASRLPATYLTSVTGTAPVVSSGGSTPAISMAAANSTVAGYMTTTYASKLDGIASGATNVTNNNQLTNGAGYITGSGNTTGSAGSVSGLTLTSSASGINPDSVTQNQLGYNTSVSLFGQTDGGLYSSAYSSSWIHQIYGDFRTGQIAIRGKNSGTWQSWRTVLDSSNYTSYAMPVGSSATNSVDIRAPIFYDSNNTGYYTDPASTSSLNVIRAVGTVWVGYHGGTAYDGGAVSGYYFGGDTAGAYRIWTSFENINGNYTKLNIDWHTGIKIGAYFNYGGIRFYDDAIGYGATNGRGNKCFSVAEGDTGVRAYYDMRSPIYYDQNDTGYYLDPNTTSDSALRIRGGALHGPNVTWNTYLLVGGDGRQNYINSGTTASVCSTNGNLHMDAASGLDMFLNYYDGANIQLGNGANGIIGVISAAGNLTMNGNITAYSDRKLKTNIKTIKNAIDIVSRLRGVYFDWIESGQQSIGLIAQEAQEVVPELILENIVKHPPSFPGEEMPEDRVLSVDYGKITSILIEAIKEQQQQIEELKSLVNKLIGS